MILFYYTLVIIHSGWNDLFKSLLIKTLVEWSTETKYFEISHRSIRNSLVGGIMFAETDLSKRHLMSFVVFIMANLLPNSHPSSSIVDTKSDYSAKFRSKHKQDTSAFRADRAVGGSTVSRWYMLTSRDDNIILGHGNKWGIIIIFSKNSEL